jgi:branched-chain amino acid transport system substrate-binding protein
MSRSNENWRRLAIAAVGLAHTGACTFNTLEVSECETSAECRSDFGLGYVCRDDGRCEEADPSPRCTETYPPDLFDDRFEQRDRIVFGNIVDRSVTLFRAFERTAQLAYDQANTRGGLDGREFGAVFCSVEENPDIDDLDHIEAAVASVEYLTETVGVPAILGPATSVEVQNAFLAMTGQDVLMISPSATSPALTDLDPADVSDAEPGLLWRTAASDALQGVAIASDMLTGRDPPVTSVAAIHEVGAYGEGLYEVFARAFRDGGGEVEEYPYADSGQLAEVIAQVGSSDVQEVLFISSDTQTIIGFLDSVASLAQFETKSLFMTDPAANPDVLAEASGTALAKVRGTRPAPLDEDEDVYASFIASYAGEFGDDVRGFPFTPNVYDAAWLLAYGAAWATLREDGAIAGSTMARGLRRVSSGQDVEIRPSGWSSVLQVFRGGGTVDLKGASGELDFDPDTEETSAGIEVWHVKDRTITSIYTIEP